MVRFTSTMEYNDMRIAKRTIWSGVRIMTVDAVAKSRWGKEDRVYFGPRPVDSGTQASPRRPPRDSQFASLSHCNSASSSALVLFSFFVPVHNWIPIKAQSMWVESMGPLTRCPVTLFPLTSPLPKKKTKAPYPQCSISKWTDWQLGQGRE